MDALAIFLLLLIIVLLGIIVYLALNPQYEVVTQVVPRHARPRLMRPQFGPYWVHGGQLNSDLLY